MTLLRNGQKVLIHSMGDDRTCEGYVRGIASNMYPGFAMYIVEFVKPVPWDHEYDCIIVPVGCLTKMRV